jgi:hypothetical protein
MVQTWYNSANFNNIASPLISSAMKQSSANGASVTGATGFGQDNVGGAGSFVEGLRGVGALEAGTHGEGTGVVGIGRVELGVGYDYVLGIEAEVVNVTGTNAPVYTSFTSAQFIASFLATGDGTHTSDVAFLVNPFSQTGYGAGFVVAENSITPSGAAFVNRASIAVGLDLSVASAAYSIAQIKGVGGWRLLQDGNVAVDNTKSGVLAYSINNLDTGAGSVAQMQLNTNAGTLSVGATTIAGTAFGGLTWTGAGPTAIQAANAAGHIAFATGSGPTDAITISSSQVIQLPAVATGTPAASLCIDASNNIIKKTTTGPCI